MTKEEGKQGTYFINLVVKDYRDTFYIYITKYVPETNWLANYIDESSFSTFTGTLYLYNEEGIYTVKIEMVNGTSTNIQKHPCQESSTGTGSSGGGSGSGSGTNTTTTTGSGSGSGSSNVGGLLLQLVVVTIQVQQ